MPRVEERTPLPPAGPATDIETLFCFLELCSITAIKPAFPIDEQELAATVDATRESTRASLYGLLLASKSVILRDADMIRSFWRHLKEQPLKTSYEFFDTPKREHKKPPA